MDAAPEDFDLPTLAALAGAAASTAVQRRLAQQGHGELRLSYGYVIQRLLGANPTVGELSEALGVTQQAASKTVADMESAGLVERAADPADGRVRRIRLSERGRSVLEAAREARRELEAELGLDAGELAAARTALLRLLDRSGGLDAARTRRVRPPEDIA
ncbi:MarR family winged helix-turn-helix transcriptional regulator [Leifsonia poae]|uniref:MarR family winged helix-turn-helix transcriptional regulator n=1 Tax=Leifsonia poae TaxID=110933 RepID=UPI003D68AFD4